MFDIYQLLQYFRPNYFEPPPSYDSIPGARPQSGNVRFVNVHQLDSFDNQEYFDVNNRISQFPPPPSSEPIYENLPGYSNHTQTNIERNNRSPTKLEQLDLQL